MIREFLVARVATFAFALALGAASAASAASFDYVGSARHGQYKEVRGTFAGQPLVLKLKRIQHVADVGGLLVEQNPSYEISGASAPGAVKLAVELEDEIAQVGGLNIQTGTLVHVKGTIGGRAFQLTVHERDEIASVGGINVETDRWSELVSEPVGAPAATLKADDGHHVFAGTDGGRAFALTIEDWLTPHVTVSEEAAPELVVLVLALRPFLDVAH